MTILASELKWYKAEEVSLATTNGGLMSANEAVSGVVNNVWPHVLKAERDAGSTVYRKLFAKVANDADETLIAADLWNDLPTEGDDWIIMWKGTQTDTQATAASHSGAIYAANALNANVTAGVSTITLLLEHADQEDAYVDGEQIRLTDMVDPESATGNEEILTINGTPSLATLVLTIVVDEVIANSYTVAGGGRAMSICNVGDIEASSDNWAETSSIGTYDEGSYPVILDNIGTINETVTLTFTDATNFTGVGSVSGALGSGTIGGDFSPSNADFTKPYFTLEAAGFGGTWASAETIVFDTIPAAAPLWLKRTVPVGSSSLAGNKNTTALSGESA